MPKLSAPTVPVFIIALILAILALIGQFGSVPMLSTYQFWLAIAAWAVLTAGTLLKGV